MSGPPSSGQERRARRPCQSAAAGEDDPRRLEVELEAERAHDVEAEEAVRVGAAAAAADRGAEVLDAAAGDRDVGEDRRRELGAAGGGDGADPVRGVLRETETRDRFLGER